MGVSQASIESVSAGARSATPGTRGTAPSAHRTPDVSRILGLKVTLSVILADRLITIGSILDITPGTIIEFDVPFDAELKLNVGNRTIARGQTVKVSENFGLRLTEVMAVPDRVGALAG